MESIELKEKPAMYRYSEFAASVLPSLTALPLLCAMIALGPHPAGAQSADDLDCNKCVDTDEFAKKSVKKSRIRKGAVSTNRIKDGAVSEAKLSTDLQAHFDGRESFYIALDGDGTTATIATHGSLSFFARCVVNDAGEDRIEIVATSSASGWFENNKSDDTAGNPSLNAGEEVISETEAVDPAGSAFFDDISAASIVASDGSYLGLGGISGGLGLNIFGHDCIVMGNILRATGAL